MTNKLKVMTILGTRPEIIRLSRVMARLDVYTDHCLVHTGQNYDYELNEVFFNDLGVRKPDYFLGVGGGSLGETLGLILSKTEHALENEKPDAVLILGDTNSAISSIMARRMKIPIYHMEAGNRSFDRNVPEETNRKMVDHISDFNLVYTEHARRHLLSEGLHHRRIYLTGSPMKEVLNYYRASIDSSEILEKLNLKKREYFVVSLHREENVDDLDNLKSLAETLIEIAEIYNYPVIVSTHPRTAKKLEGLSLKKDKRVIYCKPFSFFEYNNLQMNSFCGISDSGTIAEEAALLEFPAITPRNAIERPEAIDVGCIIMTGCHRTTILRGIESATQAFKCRQDLSESHQVPSDYSIENTAERVVNLIIGTALLSNSWDGIRSNNSKG